MFAFKQDGTWVEYTGQPLPLNGGELYHVPAAWSDEEKEDGFGVYRVVEDAVPDGHRVESYTLQDFGGRPKKVAVLVADPVPDRVTANQFGKQLAALGLLSAVVDWVAQQDEATQWSFNRSATFVRDDPMMAAGFAAMGFTPAQIDAFFVEADKLK